MIICRYFELVVVIVMYLFLRFVSWFSMTSLSGQIFTGTDFSVFLYLMESLQAS